MPFVYITSLIVIFLATISNIIIYRLFSKISLFIANTYKKFAILAFLYSIILLIVFFVFNIDFNSIKWYFFILFVLCLPPAIFSIYWAIFISPFYKFPKFQKISFFVGLLLISLTSLLMIHGALIGRTKIITNNITIISEKIPKEFNGFRIVQFSDFHAGSFSDIPEFVQELVNTINSLDPDLVAFTGDIVNNHSMELTPYVDVLAQIKAKYGVYSVLGNHDYGDYVKWDSSKNKEENFQKLMNMFEKMSWHTLNDRNVTIEKNGAKIILIGVEHIGKPPFKIYGNLEKASFGIDQNLFSILLSHDPSHWQREVLPTTNIDLMLAGHTHAMQLKIAGLSPIGTIYKEWSGLYSKNNRYLYVNEGVGSVFLPMRIGAYPEITIIELQAK